MKLDPLMSIFFCCLGTSASGRAYFSRLHAPFVSKMAMVGPPPPFLSRGLGSLVSRPLVSLGLFRASLYFFPIA